MNRTLYFHCHAGISGDMTLAALIDIGVPEDYLKAELSKLALDDEFKLEVSSAMKMGISGTQVRVHQLSPDSKDDHGHSHAHDHSHDHDHARTYREIKRMIEGAPYKQGVIARALDMFRLIGEAEAKIHGKSLDEVHFHEVGAIDSIVDIVGVAIALEYLNIDTILCGPVELGSGRVHCAHGNFPVPAPATSEILKGVPTQNDGLEGEATTPTGAAILKSNVDHFQPRDVFTTEKVGYGIGHKDFAVPNVLRVLLGDYTSGSKSDIPPAANYEITTNIDDMSAEGFQPMLDRLFEAGASDTFLTPVVMKKGRLAQTVTVLCRAENLDELAKMLMTESSSIGVRVKPVWKQMLEREMRTVKTSFGDVNVKIVSLPDGGRRWKVEHDHILAISRDTGKSYARLKLAIEQEVNAALEDLT